MKGNNLHSEKEHIEDDIINKIDIPLSRRIKDCAPIPIGLRVPIIELITYKAAMTGRAIRFENANPA